MMMWIWECRRPDFEKFEAVVESELPEYFHYLSYRKDEGYTHYVPRDNGAVG